MANFIADTLTLTIGDSYVTSMCKSSVTLEVTRETATHKCMATTGNWDNKLPTSTNWSATFDTTHDSAQGIDIDDTILEAAPAALVFSTSTTAGYRRYSGSCIITGATINAPVDDVCTIAWTVEGTGALTEGAVPA